MVRYLEQLGYVGMSLQEQKRFFQGARQRMRKVPMLPRYVFFDANAGAEPDWYQIMAIPYVQKILEYGDGVRALRESDLEFIAWMKGMSGLLDVSQVLQVGTRIRVIGGPLKHYEGKIVEVKKHRGMVAIRIGEDTHFAKIWCPVEYVDKA